MNILITGAASGIGRGLALKLARPGVSLQLCDHAAEGLTETARQCDRQGAHTVPAILDTRNRQGMADWIATASGERLDMAFLCAGITGGLPPEADDGLVLEREERVWEMLDTNLTGTLNTFFPVVKAMRTQDRNGENLRGRICVMASVAGFVCYPGTPSYSASKAALDRFIIGNASRLGSFGISLTSVCCGFVDTAMVKGNRFPMPGLVSTEEAVRRILRGTLRQTRRIIFPAWLVMGSRLMDLLPPRLAERYYGTQPSAQPAGMPDF
ncbi:SDR family NAD(P)-dependent oxidoreductase [Gluconobacter sp. Dm-62]|uniref:SDR family NAD(P)-dependent oxidoreductase n=1 Tax=Gluconobacter sp. Dm-62 TaxID=2799804 RepID=UPI001B8DA1D9|nr:SDR family NAD(P)-dependent oxidoreductase [Gluconobacter sp. Dm-62]MBS1103380.1 SDR family NAD(P)-dependent oxidoreductase [Gluconobacter sp. Dm-62]